VVFRAGKADEAEALLRRALAIMEKNFGPQHPAIVGDLSNLATLLSHLDRGTEAEPLTRRALRIAHNVTRTSGYQHPLLPSLVRNYFDLVRETLPPREAADRLSSLGSDLRDLYRQMEDSPASALGMDNNVNSLAMILTEEGQYDKAAELLEKALSDRDKGQATSSAELLLTIENLGIVYSKQRKFRQAVRLLLQVFESRERSAGFRDPATLKSASNLAEPLWEVGRRQEAEGLLRRTLAAEKELFGPASDETLSTINNLGLLLLKSRRLDEAKPLLEEALQVTERRHGPEHPSSLVALHNLAGLCAESGELDKAGSLWKTALDRAQILFGPEHPHTKEIAKCLRSLSIARKLSRWLPFRRK
jgi:tetratricopeptide (TPR) repeat protein